MRFCSSTTMKYCKMLEKFLQLLPKRLAEEEYEKFAPIQDRNYISDFDREIKEMQQKKQIQRV